MSPEEGRGQQMKNERYDLAELEGEQHDLAALERERSGGVTRMRRTQWRHFCRGDLVRVGGWTGRYRFSAVYTDTDGLDYVEAIEDGGAGRGRVVDPRLHEIVDFDAAFTWETRLRDEVYYPEALGGGLIPDEDGCPECGGARCEPWCSFGRMDRYA